VVVVVAAVVAEPARVLDHTSFAAAAAAAADRAQDLRTGRTGSAAVVDKVDSGVAACHTTAHVEVEKGNHSLMRLHSQSEATWAVVAVAVDTRVVETGEAVVKGVENMRDIVVAGVELGTVDTAAAPAVIVDDIVAAALDETVAHSLVVARTAVHRKLT